MSIGLVKGATAVAVVAITPYILTLSSAIIVGGAVLVTIDVVDNLTGITRQITAEYTMSELEAYPKGEFWTKIGVVLAGSAFVIYSNNYYYNSVNSCEQGLSVSTESVSGDESLKPQNLIKELENSSVKYNKNEVVMVTKTTDGKLLWLESGSDAAGLQHIINKHSVEFAAKGITDIPSFLHKVLQIASTNTGVGASGPYADYVYNGSTYRIAYGTNGYIVSFYPID